MGVATDTSTMFAFNNNTKKNVRERQPQQLLFGSCLYIRITIPVRVRTQVRTRVRTRVQVVE